jgi:hypothetical protein
MSNVNPFLEAALSYAQRGLAVIALHSPENNGCSCKEKANCRTPGKHPRWHQADLPHGANSATTDEKIIRLWWQRWPKANVGIATGEISGLIVVDIDPRNGGDKSLKRLPGNLPFTPTSRTGGKGEHYLLRHPGNGCHIENDLGFAGFAGIDLKSDGGLIVAPPSRHISGDDYFWKINLDTTLASTPNWLLELIKKESAPDRKSAPLGEVISQGERVKTLRSLAGTMRKRGMNEPAILAALESINQTQCAEPLPDSKIKDIARSYGKYAPGEITVKGTAPKAQDRPQREQGEQAAQEDKAKPTQAELLIKLAGNAELFHDMNRKGYATIPVDGHMQTWPIKSTAFRDWLRGRFYKAHNKTSGGQALQDALDLLAAQARYDGPEHEVYVRIAHTGDKVYVDLANGSWQAVEITPQGWCVVNTSPVKFRRPRGLAPMPTPEQGGNLADLKPFINCREVDWPLVVAWIIGAFSSGPYPIMIFQGEQGTAKSTTARALKNVVDPGHSPLRTAPRDSRDLMISASNSWCLSFDNLSNLPPWLSDLHCRISTGGGISNRELYTNSDETILDAMRPQILNGIDSLVSRADLADRAILLELPQIENGRRRPEKDLWKAFDAAQPGILGAVFNALSAALANVHGVKLAELPRMADFAIWVVAAEPALPWEPGTFLYVYSGNRTAVVEHSLEGDVVAVAVRLLMADRETWVGAPSALLEALETITPESTIRSKAWPKAANSLSNRLRRAATFLRAVGIEIESGYEKRARRWLIRKGMQKTVTTVATVASEEFQEVTCNDPCNDATIHEKRPLQPKVNNHEGCSDSNDSNDKIQTFSKGDDEVDPLRGDL